MHAIYFQILNVRFYFIWIERFFFLFRLYRLRLYYFGVRLTKNEYFVHTRFRIEKREKHIKHTVNLDYGLFELILCFVFCCVCGGERFICFYCHLFRAERQCSAVQQYYNSFWNEKFHTINGFEFIFARQTHQWVEREKKKCRLLFVGFVVDSFFLMFCSNFAKDKFICTQYR